MSFIQPPQTLSQGAINFHGVSDGDHRSTRRERIAVRDHIYTPSTIAHSHDLIAAAAHGKTARRRPPSLNAFLASSLTCMSDEILVQKYGERLPSHRPRRLYSVLNAVTSVPLTPAECTSRPNPHFISISYLLILNFCVPCYSLHFCPCGPSIPLALFRLTGALTAIQFLESKRVCSILFTFSGRKNYRSKSQLSIFKYT